MGQKFYQLNIDEVLFNISLFTEYDISGEGHRIIVEKEHLNDAIDEIVNEFTALIEDAFEPYNEEEEK